MSTNVCRFNASPAQVWDVISDGWTYASWVVGASHIRAVDAGFPAPGTQVHHAFGVWPAVVRDTTVAQDAEPGRHLRMKARGWPAGEAVIDLTLTADGDQTVVTMVEEPVSGPGKWLHNPLADRVLHRRNTEALNRLRALVER